MPPPTRSLPGRAWRLPGLPVLLILVVLAAGCSGDAGTEPVPRTTHLGLTANPAEGAPPGSLASALHTARPTGVDLLYLGHLWRELEPAPGQVDVSGLRADGAPKPAWETWRAQP